MFSVLLVEIWIFFIISPVKCAKKYNVEEEAVRLYGEDFNTVLKRFRRSADYLKILKEKQEQLSSAMQEVTDLTSQHMETLISQKVTEMLNREATGGQTGSTTTPATRNPVVLRINKRYKSKYNTFRRAEDVDDIVRQLDRYHQSRSKLDVKESNMYKSIGFEMAKKMVELVVKGMGPVVNTFISGTTREEEEETTLISSTIPTINIRAYSVKYRRKNDEHKPQYHISVVVHTGGRRENSSYVAVQRNRL